MTQVPIDREPFKRGTVYEMRPAMGSSYLAEFTPQASVPVHNRDLGEPYTFRMVRDRGFRGYFPLYVNDEGEVFDDNGKQVDVREVSSVE